MAELSSVSGANLQATLENAKRGKAAKRLVIALAYKDGVAVKTLTDRYAIPQSTLYSWLSRFEAMPIEEAIRD